MIHASQQLGLGSGLVLAVPIPAEAATEGKAIEDAIKQALAEAAQKGVHGSEVSARHFPTTAAPFLPQGRCSASSLLHHGRIASLPHRTASLSLCFT